MKKKKKKKKKKADTTLDVNKRRGGTLMANETFFRIPIAYSHISIFQLKQPNREASVRSAFTEGRPNRNTSLLWR
jgi:hypothetical protein